MMIVMSAVVIKQHYSPMGRETSTECALQSMKLYVTPVLGGDLWLLIPADEGQQSYFFFQLVHPLAMKATF